MSKYIDIDWYRYKNPLKPKPEFKELILRYVHYIHKELNNTNRFIIGKYIITSNHNKQYLIKSIDKDKVVRVEISGNHSLLFHIFSLINNNSNVIEDFKLNSILDKI